MSLLVLIVIIVLAMLMLAGLSARGAGAANVGATVAVVSFIGLVLLAISALVAPKPYQEAADIALRAAGVRDRVRDMDEAFIFDDLAASGRDLGAQLTDALTGDTRLRGLLNRLVGEDEVADALATVTPAPAEAEADDEDEFQRGIFEQRLYPALVDAFAGVLRMATLLSSMAAMVAVAGLGFAAGAARRLATANQRLAVVEARLRDLERSLSDQRPPPDEPTS